MLEVGAWINTHPIAQLLVGRTFALTLDTRLPCSTGHATRSTMQSVGLCIDTPPKTRGWRSRRARSDTPPKCTQFSRRTTRSTGPAMRIIRRKIDTAITTLCQIFRTQALPSHTALSSQTSLPTRSAMQTIALCIHTTAQTSRWCGRRARWNARSARAHLTFRTRAFAIPAVLCACHRINTGRPTQKLSFWTTTSPFLANTAHRADFATCAAMLALDPFVYARSITKIRKIGRTSRNALTKDAAFP